MVSEEVKPASLSVVIPTYQGGHKLLVTLSALEKQSVSGFEVVVVVDGSTDQTMELLESFKTDRFILKVIKQGNQGRSAVRNRGVSRTGGSLLCFIDDDMALEPEVLIAHLRHHSGTNRSVLVGGVYVPNEYDDECMTYRRSIEKVWYQALPDYPKPMTQEHFFLSAAHLSLPKELFIKFNGFNQALSDGEDEELGYRLLKGKISVYLDKSLVGWHMDRTSWKQYFARKRQYQLAKKQLEEIHPEKDTHIPQEVPLLKKLILPIIRYKGWISWMETNRLKWIPQSIRFRLYSLIIWTHTT